MAERRSLSLSTLNPGDRAAFSTSIRLLSCLVTESLVDALFFPLKSNGIVGFAAIQFQKQSNQAGDIADATNTLAVVPLSHVPILRRPTSKGQDGVRTIGLLDPLDAAPLVYVFDDAVSTDAPDVGLIGFPLGLYVLTTGKRMRGRNLSVAVLLDEGGRESNDVPCGGVWTQ